jgi:hypothetical protein
LTKISSNTVDSLDDRDLYQAIWRSGNGVFEQDIQ